MTNDLSIRMSKVTNQTSPPSPPSNSKRTDSVPSRPNPLPPTVPTKPNERDPRNPSRSPPWPTSKLRPSTKTGPHPQWPSLFGLSAISTQKGTSKDRAGTTSAKIHPSRPVQTPRSHRRGVTANQFYRRIFSTINPGQRNITRPTVPSKHLPSLIRPNAPT